MTRLTRHEQETIINFNEGEDSANVYTHNSKLKKRLDGLHAQRNSEVVLQRADAESATYTVPKAWIRINPPRSAAKLTYEQKQERAARLKRR